MLELQHISWTAPGGSQVVRDVSFSVPEGKLTVITGPNGGGKTTLAKLIAGIETPDSGKNTPGRPGHHPPWTSPSGLGLGSASPFSSLCGLRALPSAACWSWPPASPLPASGVCEMLGRVGLCGREYLDREVDATLSGGEMKRIEIATVLARHTKLSLFDEPEAGIDLWSFTNLIDVFQSLRGKLNGTLLIISHQERILQIADEIVIISGGQLQEKGPAGDILPKLMEGSASCGGCVKREAVFS